MDVYVYNKHKSIIIFVSNTLITDFLCSNLRQAESELAALSSGLATVDERVAALKEQLGQHTRDAAAIELSLNNATKTIQAARSLLDQLAHEYTAWEQDVSNSIYLKYL